MAPADVWAEYCVSNKVEIYEGGHAGKRGWVVSVVGSMVIVCQPGGEHEVCPFVLWSCFINLRIIIGSGSITLCPPLWAPTVSCSASLLTWIPVQVADWLHEIESQFHISQEKDPCHCSSAVQRVQGKDLGHRCARICSGQAQNHACASGEDQTHALVSSLLCFLSIRLKPFNSAHGSQSLVPITGGPSIKAIDHPSLFANDRPSSPVPCSVTPLPDPSFYESLSPSWTTLDLPPLSGPSASLLPSAPSSSSGPFTLPADSPLSFLVWPSLQRVRFKMREISQNSHRVLEFHSIAASNTIWVRNGIHLHDLDARSLVHLHPEAIGDLQGFSIRYRGVHPQSPS